MRIIVATAALAMWCVASLGVQAGETVIPNRLATAKVGEWVLYSIPDGKTQKHMVVERSGTGEDANVSIRVEDFENGKVVQTHEMVEIAGPEMAPMPPTKDPEAVAMVRNDTVSLKGKTFPVTAIDIKKGDDLLRTWYISPEFPVYGLIKRVEDKGSDPSFEAIDFGGM